MMACFDSSFLSLWQVLESFHHYLLIGRILSLSPLSHLLALLLSLDFLLFTFSLCMRDILILVQTYLSGSDYSFFRKFICSRQEDSLISWCWLFRVGASSSQDQMQYTFVDICVCARARARACVCVCFQYKVSIFLELTSILQCSCVCSSQVCNISLESRFVLEAVKHIFSCRFEQFNLSFAFKNVWRLRNREEEYQRRNMRRLLNGFVLLYIYFLASKIVC